MLPPADAAGADAILPSVMPECPPGEGDGIAIEGATAGKNHVRRVSWSVQPTEVRTFGADEVLIIFPDPVDELSAEMPAHYQIEPPVARTTNGWRWKAWFTTFGSPSSPSTSPLSWYETSFSSGSTFSTTRLVTVLRVALSIATGGSIW